MKKSPSVFVTVLNYNGKSVIRKCLLGIFELDYPNLEVIVVDNHSTDGSLEIVREFFPRCHIIANPANLGFSAGNNIGIRFALEKMADYVFLLNNDAVLEKNTLARLIEDCEQNSKIGIISPVILNKKSKKIWFAGGKINWLRMKAEHLNDPSFPETKLFESQYICGCAMLIKQKVFREIGLFDEKFFLYYEDADFSLRARKKGFHLAVCPRTVAYHAERSEYNENNKTNKTYWLIISGIIFFRKHTPFFLKPWQMIYFLGRRLKNYCDLMFRKKRIAFVVRQAYRDIKHV